jgi:hypothetical protein
MNHVFKKSSSNLNYFFRKPSSFLNWVFGISSTLTHTQPPPAAGHGLPAGERFISRIKPRCITQVKLTTGAGALDVHAQGQAVGDGALLGGFLGGKLLQQLGHGGV